MTVKFRDCLALLFTAVLSSQVSANVGAQEFSCFSSLNTYLTKSYGTNYSEDENIVVKKKRFGNTNFTVVEDTTSGTNHVFTLLSESPEEACPVLVTTPAVSLEVSTYDKSGFPLELKTEDQAAPGSPANRITYRFDSKKKVYVAASCHEVRYQGKRRIETKINCSKILNY